MDSLLFLKRTWVSVPSRNDQHRLGEKKEWSLTWSGGEGRHQNRTRLAMDPQRVDFGQMSSNRSPF